VNLINIKGSPIQSFNSFLGLHHAYIGMFIDTMDQ